MKLEFLPDAYAVCRLPPDSEIPTWCTGSFLNITRTPDELSLVVAANLIPDNFEIQANREFRCFRVADELDFGIIGVIAKISSALADAKIPILSLSTYNTDYFLVADKHRELATTVLEQAGYVFMHPDEGI